MINTHFVCIPAHLDHDVPAAALVRVPGEVPVQAGGAQVGVTLPQGLAAGARVGRALALAPSNNLGLNLNSFKYTNDHTCSPASGWSSPCCSSRTSRRSCPPVCSCTPRRCRAAPGGGTGCTGSCSAAARPCSGPGEVEKVLEVAFPLSLEKIPLPCTAQPVWSSLPASTSGPLASFPSLED